MNKVPLPLFMKFLVNPPILHLKAKRGKSDQHTANSYMVSILDKPFPKFDLKDKESNEVF